jgi:hypothetical protein
MNSKPKFIATVFGVVALASAAVSTASAGGFFGDVINGIYPGVGTAMDAWNREFKNRQSSESVYNQVDRTLTWNDNPIGRPAQYPQQRYPQQGYAQQRYAQPMPPPMYLPPSYPAPQMVYRQPNGYPPRFVPYGRPGW